VLVAIETGVAALLEAEVVEAATEAETAEAARMTVGDRLCSTKADVVVVVPLA
jgi:hypothetical protein